MTDMANAQFQRPVYVLSGFALWIFTLGIALAPNYATVLVVSTASSTEMATTTELFPVQSALTVSRWCCGA